MNNLFIVGAVLIVLTIGILVIYMTAGVIVLAVISVFVHRYMEKKKSKSTHLRRQS